jgi:hypothetical protein
MADQRYVLERADLDQLRDVMLELGSGRFMDSDKLGEHAKRIEGVLRRANELQEPEPSHRQPLSRRW